MGKVDTRTLPVAAVNERRRQAVKLRIEGAKLKDISRITELSPTTIIAAYKAYCEGGWKAVPVSAGGRSTGDGRTLTPEQEELIQAKICDHTPDQLKLEFALWNREAVRELIELETGIKMPVRTVGHYLKRWSFTPQKPIRRFYEQKPEAVDKWLKEDYPAIAEQAKAEEADIFWGDETGLRSDDVRGRSYSRAGMTPVIRVTGRREGFSMISAVTNRGKLRWMMFKGAMKAELLIEFLRRLTKDAPRKVFLILDNLRVHHSLKVQEWLEGRADQIRIFYLPSYSPELNPDEILNANLKHAVRSAAPARKKGDLKARALARMRHLSKSPAKVRAFFRHKTVRYAA